MMSVMAPAIYPTFLSDLSHLAHVLPRRRLDKTILVRINSVK